MKYTFKLFIAFAFIFSVSHAQQKGFSFGFNAGPNYSFLYGNPHTNAVTIPSVYFAAGFSLTYDLPKVLSFSTGLHFEKKGDHYQADDYAYRYPYYYSVFKGYTTMDYIIAPLLARFSFGKRSKLFFNIGGYAAYLAGAQAKYKILYPENPKMEPERERKSIKKDFSSFDFGGCAGLGVLAPLTDIMSLSVEVRNSSGFKDIVRGGGLGEVKTNATSLMIGLVFKPGNRKKESMDDPIKKEGQ